MLVILMAAGLMSLPTTALPDVSATPAPIDAPPDDGGVLTPSPWFSIEEEVTPSYDGLSGSSSTLNLRVQIPLGPMSLLQRLQLPGRHRLQLIKLKLPFVTTAPATAITGSGDTTLVELGYLGTQQQKWVLGPAFRLPTASSNSLGSGKWSAGPAAGYTYTFLKGSSAIGLYAQSFFSFAGPKSRPNVAQTQLQPEFVVKLPHGWGLGTSQMQFKYDWRKNQWPDAPLGIRIAKVFETESARLTAGFEMEKDLGFVVGSPGWTLRLNLKYGVK